MLDVLGPVAGIAGERRDKDRVGQLPAALVSWAADRQATRIQGATGGLA
jgi:hypothetical protein